MNGRKRRLDQLMRKNAKAVLFDLDGTLTNTLADIAAAMNRALAAQGLPLWETDDYRYLVGNGARTLAQRAVRERADLLEPVLASYQQYYETHNRVRTRPYPGIPELLQALTDRQIPCCVLSNKPHADTLEVVHFFFPDIPFAVIQGQTERWPLKPAPDAALHIAETLHLPPADFMYLGDTAVDMTCACRAGMRPVGVLWGFRTEKELTENGADLLLSAPMDLLNYL